MSGLPCKDTESVHFKTPSRPSPDIKSASVLVSNILVCKTMENKHLLLINYPACGIPLEQRRQPKTIRNCPSACLPGAQDSRTSPAVCSRLLPYDSKEEWGPVPPFSNTGEWVSFCQCGDIRPRELSVFHYVCYTSRF